MDGRLMYKDEGVMVDTEVLEEMHEQDEAVLAEMMAEEKVISQMVAERNRQTLTEMFMTFGKAA